MSRKQKTGIVVSDKMDKSIVVEVTRNKQHPLYKKFIRVRKRFMAHDENNTAHIGDFVKIEESRPLSRRKSWALAEIIRVAPGQGLAIKHTATAVASGEDETQLNINATPAPAAPVAVAEAPAATDAADTGSAEGETAKGSAAEETE
jgi:small subunit ribosomal protein S17